MMYVGRSTLRCTRKVLFLATKIVSTFSTVSMNNSKKKSEKKKIDFGEWGDCSTSVIYCRRSGGNR